MRFDHRIFLAILILAVPPLVGASLLWTDQASSTVTTMVEERLLAVATSQAARVDEVVAHESERFGLVTSRTQLRISLDAYATDPDGNDSQTHRERMVNIIQDARAALPDYQQVHIIDERGEVIASTTPSQHGTQRLDALATDAVAGREGFRIFRGDNGTVFERAGPLHLDGRLIGAAIIESDAQGLATITSDYTGLGESGEVLLAAPAPDGGALFLTPVRFDADAALVRIVPPEQTSVPVVRALAGESGVLPTALDYRGVPILSAATSIHNAPWVVVAKIDAEEALRPISDLRTATFVATAFIVGAIVVVARITSGPVARPAEQLAEANRRLAEAERQRAAHAKELARSNRELEQFAYLASHDLQAPLRQVSGFTQLLDRRLADRLDDEARELFGYVRDGVDRMTRLIESLLEFSRMQRAKIALEDVPLDAVLAEVRQDLGDAINAAGARIEAGPLAIVRGDRSLVRRLLQNLISNAITHGKVERPVVQVETETETDGHHVRVRVRDNGQGFDPAHADAMFEMFKRLDTSTQGTGIGLAACRAIVDRMGGTIRAESRPGHGATFTFTLPAASKPSPTPPGADDDPVHE